MRVIPALSTNIAITVTVAELLNPAIPSSGVTKPKRIRTIATHKAVKSTGSHSATKATKATTKTVKVRIIGVGIDLFFRHEPANK